MSTSQLRMQFITTDGQTFSDSREASKHQRRLDATNEFATGLTNLYGLDMPVSINVATYVAQNVELVFRMLGKVYRAPSAGDDPTTESNPATTNPAGEAAGEGESQA